MPVGLRAVQDDRPRAGAESGLQLIGVDAPVGLAQRDVARDGAGQDGIRPVILVERLEDDHLVARINEGEHGGDHPLGRPAGDGDLGLRIDRPGRVEAGRLGGDRLAEVAGSPRDGVLVDVLIDRSLGRLLELGRARKIREPLGQVHRIVQGGMAGHLADDGLGEAGGASGDAGEIDRVWHERIVAARGADAPGRVTAVRAWGARIYDDVGVSGQFEVKMCAMAHFLVKMGSPSRGKRTMSVDTCMGCTCRRASPPGNLDG